MIFNPLCICNNDDGLLSCLSGRQQERMNRWKLWSLIRHSIITEESWPAWLCSVDVCLEEIRSSPLTWEKHTRSMSWASWDPMNTRQRPCERLTHTFLFFTLTACCFNLWPLSVSGTLVRWVMWLQEWRRWKRLRLETHFTSRNSPWRRCRASNQLKQWCSQVCVCVFTHAHTMGFPEGDVYNR